MDLRCKVLFFIDHLNARARTLVWDRAQSSCRLFCSLPLLFCSEKIQRGSRLCIRWARIHACQIRAVFA